MAKSRDERHRYGQHYTPDAVARLLAAFAIKSANDLVFDPSCGDGRLLNASLQIKAHLSSQQRSRRLAVEVFGIDRSRSAVELAARTKARVCAKDFFSLEPGALLCDTTRLPAQFDAIIGNPPYIRQEVMSALDKQRIRRRLERDHACVPQIFWPLWSGRSDAYVYFFARAVRFLKDEGRLAFLTASSWLDAGYGAALRQFLLKNFRIIAVIESNAETFFDDASINTCITVLEREPREHARCANQVRFVQLTRPLAEIIHGDLMKSVEFARSIEQARLSSTADAYRTRVINQAALEAQGSGWGKYLRADDVLFQIIERGNNRLRRLSNLARVRFGVKTGANDFFYLKGVRSQDSKFSKGNGLETQQQTMKELKDIAAVRRGLTTGANEFFYLRPIKDATETGDKKWRRPAASKSQTRALGSIVPVEDSAGNYRLMESRFLSPVVFSLKEIPAIFLDRRQTSRLFFNCGLAPEGLRGTRALDYICSGERAGYAQRPTCAARKLWYAVADGLKPAPLIFPSKVGERWLVALNRDGVFEDKKLYGIFPRRGVSRLLLAALLNSTWARYYAEVTCRQMTGAQAIADIDVTVAEQMLVPNPRELPPSLKNKLEAALLAIARRPVLSIFEEVNRADRRMLDELVLLAIGFNNKQERRIVLNRLYAAVTALVRTRLNNSRQRSGETQNDEL